MTENRPKGDPLVTIRCMVYNHEPYLRQCLDGFVMQETTFPFEAIVHDDASTDGSAAILREYAEKYPDIIKPIYETENQWGKGTISKTMDAAMHPASKYIAFCEGDDYWTDPHKLQLQVDFLETHPDYVICSHNYRLYYQDNQRFDKKSFYDWLTKDKGNDLQSVEYSLENYFDGWWTQPLTCVYRRGLYIDEIKQKGYKSVRDDVFYYTVLTHGKGMLLLSEMGVYRIHGGGGWSSQGGIKKAKLARENALQIYQIENDRRAFSIIGSCTEKILIDLYESGKKCEFLKEFISFFRIAPLKESYRLFCLVGRCIMGRTRRKLLKRI